MTVGGELDVNYQATASGSTAYLNLQGGTLSVAGPTVVGHARMDTSPADTSAQVTQSGGLLAAGGPMTIGQLGAGPEHLQCQRRHAHGLQRTDRGLTGQRRLNISGSATSPSAARPGLAIGGDPTGGHRRHGQSLRRNAVRQRRPGAGQRRRRHASPAPAESLSVGGNLVAAGAGTLVLEQLRGDVLWRPTDAQRRAAPWSSFPKSGERDRDLRPVVDL